MATVGNIAHEVETITGVSNISLVELSSNNVANSINKNSKGVFSTTPDIITGKSVTALVLLESSNSISTINKTISGVPAFNIGGDVSSGGSGQSSNISKQRWY